MDFQGGHALSLFISLVGGPILVSDLVLQPKKVRNQFDWLPAEESPGRSESTIKPRRCFCLLLACFSAHTLRMFSIRRPYLTWLGWSAVRTPDFFELLTGQFMDFWYTFYCINSFCLRSYYKKLCRARITWLISRTRNNHGHGKKISCRIWFEVKDQKFDHM
jgi:hypothetical protein